MTTLSDKQASAVQGCVRQIKDGAPVTLLDGYAGTGKQQPLDAKIQTPTGARLMGELAVGDYVMGVDGAATRIVAVHPQGVQPCFEISFRDGSKTRCGAEHLWTVTSARREYKGRPPITLTLSEILEKGVRLPCGLYRYKIPLCSPVEYEHKNYVIEPYVLGVMLGNGSLGAGKPIASISPRDSSIAKRLEAIIPMGMEINAHNKGGACPRYYIKDNENGGNRFSNELRRLNLDVLSAEKHIPEEYLLGSIEQRWELLRGLMDTDGHCTLNRTGYSSSSLALISDVRNLVQSLGGTAIQQSSGREGEYALNVKVNQNPFTVAFKASRWSPSTKNPPSRYITGIRAIEPEEQQCITVDRPDGLYLTDEYIVTHNSTILPHVIDDLGLDPSTVAFLAPTGKAAKVMRTKLRALYPQAVTSTIHSAIYRAKPAPISTLETDLYNHQSELQTYLAQKSEAGEPADKVHVSTLRKAVQRLEMELDSLYRDDKLSFQLNVDSLIQTCSLIVLDERSMVNRQMGDDLTHFGVPIFAMGDPGQLPPVEGQMAFGVKADFFLNEIHRQAADNPIIRLSTMARNGEEMPYGDYGQGVEVMRRRDYVHDFDTDTQPQFLVGMNKTRWRITQMMRMEYGIIEDERLVVGPRAGEPMIIKKNNREYPQLVNGTMVKAVSDGDIIPGQTTMRMSFEDEDGILYDDKNVFQGLFEEHWTRIPGKFSAAGNLAYRAKMRSINADFGYVLTAHSAQGSQWDDVVVIDESGCFRKDAHKWLYTACTRAAKTLKVLI
jgi:exodeoxyribonuclease-5